MIKQSKYITSFLLDATTNAALEKLAKSSGMNKSAIIRCLITQAMKDGKFDFKNPLLTT